MLTRDEWRLALDQFLLWAGDNGLCLDMRLLGRNAEPHNPFLDDETLVIFEAWLASRNAMKGAATEGAR